MASETAATRASSTISDEGDRISERGLIRGRGRVGARVRARAGAMAGAMARARPGLGLGLGLGLPPRRQRATLDRGCAVDDDGPLEPYSRAAAHLVRVRVRLRLRLRVGVGVRLRLRLRALRGCRPPRRPRRPRPAVLSLERLRG